MAVEGDQIIKGGKQNWTKGEILRKLAKNVKFVLENLIEKLCNFQRRSKIYLKNFILKNKNESTTIKRGCKQRIFI